jgi:hypothetical protein
MSLFFRLLGKSDKAEELTVACELFRIGRRDEHRFEVHPEEFEQIPGSPFAYWTSKSIRSLFSKLEPFGSSGRSAEHGCSTKDDNRFVRLHWEVLGLRPKWRIYAKGGAFSPFYQDVATVINWGEDAEELEAALLKKFPYLGNNANWVLHRESSYFKAGIKWPLRASSFAPQAMPRDVIFSGRSYAAFAEKEEDILPMLAVLNSSIFDYLFKILLGRFGFPEFLVGTVLKVPFPNFDPGDSDVLHRLSTDSWRFARSLDLMEETSHAFLLPRALLESGRHVNITESRDQLKKLQAEINAFVVDQYQISLEDQRAAELASNAEASLAEQDTENNRETEDPAETILGLLSWAVGVAFGRFDWRLATGERAAPQEPEPFDPLPDKSSGMLPDNAEPFMANAGILVDDAGNSLDLARVVDYVLSTVDAPVDTDVRQWLRRTFFPYHLKQYSKSRRKAPIYWPLGTPSGEYTLWLYYPVLTSQTLYTAVNDFVEPKLKHVAENLEALRAKGRERSKKEDRELERLESVELELMALHTSLLEIAPDYKPNHDDGVQITAAPLAELFQHKPWQNVLKDTWKKLEAGDYDWAQLAMNYWPDRVREKCEVDKSLAIAHGLEDLYEGES